MGDTLRLRKSFKAGTKNDPRDVAGIADALWVTGHLPRQKGGAPAPSEAAVGGALRSFQDREGLVVDGLARPGGQTEHHLSHMADREAERAARPPRTGPIRFGTLTADNYRESHGMARGVVRRKDHRSAVAFLRRVFEDDPGGALPEAMQLADRVDDLNREHGKRFRADLVKMLGTVQPTLAPIMASGRIPQGGSTHVGTTLLSPAAFSAKTAGVANQGEESEDDATELARALPLGRVRDRAQEIQERIGDLDEAAEVAEQEEMPSEAGGLIAAGLLRGAIVNFRRKGYGDAADALSHYLEGGGEDIDFKPEEIRKYKIIQFAEEENRDQIIGGLFDQPGGPSGSQAAFARIAGLEDGESVDLEPNVVWKNVTQAEVNRLSEAGDPEGKVFIGKTRLVAEAKLRAERHGDTIVITGTIEQVWSDPYDFVVKTPEGEKPSGGAGSEEAVTAERTGYAQRYNRGSGWTQTVRITIPITDGRLGTPRVEWEDTDEVVDWKTWESSKPLD